MKLNLKPLIQLKPWDKFIRLTWTIGLGLLLIGMMSGVGHSASHFGDGMIIVGALLVTFPWMLTVGWRAGRAVGKEAVVAMQDIPSPQYIAGELRKEWGRDPTAQEVQALHQMLTSRHNQALINTGIGFGALYLMTK